MPDPVSRNDNPTIREFYDDDPTGPGAVEVQRAQRPIQSAGAVITELGNAVGEIGLKEAAFRAGEHLLKHAGARGAADALQFIGRGLLAAELTVKAHEYSVELPRERGEAVGRGFSSDQARFAGAMIAEVAAPGLLPAGYVPFERARVVGTGSLSQAAGFRLATKIQVDIAKGDPQALAFRDALVSSVRTGVDAAHLYHIDSREALNGLLAGNSDFRERYETDAGFQIGVRAAMWQARVHPDDFATAERERGLQTTAMQLAQGA